MVVGSLARPCLRVDPKQQARQRKLVQMAKIYIVFYSMYGHILQMAKAMKEGVDKVPGCEGVLYQVGTPILVCLVLKPFLQPPGTERLVSFDVRYPCCVMLC
jgi:hypothetical protein